MEKNELRHIAYLCMPDRVILALAKPDGIGIWKSEET